jgi:ribosomal protein S18 acetylase RimI-like enzyme
VSDKAEAEALRELAANRGCKLVRSRRRTPGRGDFGRYGLEDAKTGKPVLGIGKSGLTATAEEIETFLRSGAAAGWKRSLGATPKRKAEPVAARLPKTSEPQERPKPSRKPRPDPEPVKTSRPRQEEKPAEPPAPKIRDARPGDAEALAGLIRGLGYDLTAADAKKRLAALRRANEAVIVAETDRVVGAASLHVTPVLHRPRPVGRITMMVVDEECRGEGIGSLLIAEAEARLKARGCGLIEVTSNRKRLRAHHFYEGLGYERTSYRFAKDLRG